MNNFLQLMASSLYEKFGNDMKHVVVVFPNKRASLFLNRCLSSISMEKGDGSPIWAPRYMTISELFQSIISLHVVDSVEAVCRLYDVYKEHIHNAESIDKFYGWGEVMLSDFNLIDQQMANAKQLFANIKDGHIENPLEFLDAKQLDALEHYFGKLSDKSEQQRRFLELWNQMYGIYQDFKKNLLDKGKLYDGALCRKVVEEKLYENIDTGLTYVFAGFNMLSPVQEAFLKGIKGCADCLFYWDYIPMSYEKDSLNGLFSDACQYIHKYIGSFPNELSEEELVAEGKPQLRYIKTDTVNAQTRFISNWFEEEDSDGVAEEKKDHTDKAIVLAEESLLPQVLTNLPSCGINITMGFPLDNTPVMSFVRMLIDLQLKGKRKGAGTGSELKDRFYKLFLQKIEKHPFYQYMDEGVWAQSCDEKDGSKLLQYLKENIESVLSLMPVRNEALEKEGTALNAGHVYMYEEALFRVHKAISQLQTLEVDLKETSLATRLLDRVLRSTSVPFHGEPLAGMQVMGVLETRSLNFKHVLLLSANDGVLPRSSQSATMIPYYLRSAFNLDIEKEQVNVYAYNFFRLLRHAQDVTIMFSTSGSKMGQCEMSRFMRQILAETNMNVEDSHLDFSPSEQNDTPSNLVHEGYEKTSAHVASILKRATGERVGDEERDCRYLDFSPSAMSTYINCPLEYYFRYIEGIKVEEEITSTLQPNQFGTVFHSAAQEFYRAVAPDGEVTKEILQTVIDASKKEKSPLIADAVDKAFHKEVFNQPSSEIKGYVGELVLARQVVEDYLLRLIKIDQAVAPFRILATEQHFSSSLPVQTDKGDRQFFIGGIVDRLDYVYQHPQADNKPVIRVVDYKTGGKPSHKVMDKADYNILFDSTKESDKRPKNVLQTLLYCKAVKDRIDTIPSLDQEERKAEIMPSLIYIACPGKPEDYDARVIVQNKAVDSYDVEAVAFEPALNNFIQDHLLNQEEAFVPKKKGIRYNCQYCKYKLLCGMVDD